MAERNIKFDVTDLKAFRKEIADLATKFPEELRLVDRIVADDAAELARRKARSMGSVFAKAAGRIQPVMSGSTAAIGFASGGPANPAFLGTIKRTGWYNRRRYRPDSQAGFSRSAWVAGAHGIKQHPPWIGRSWEVAVAGEGPYAINDALAENKDYFAQVYADRFMELAERTAFKG